MSVIGSNILAGASGQGGGYTIERSLRFRSSASAYLSRTPASAGNQKTWTWSAWVKRGKLGVDTNFMLEANSGNGYNRSYNYFNTSDQLIIGDYGPSAWRWQLKTTQVFRDAGAWYHIVILVDTTQATSSDRVKLYINGEQVTSFDTSTYPSLNYSTYINSTYQHLIGYLGYAGQRYFDGYLTEVNFIDGQALDASSFGEFDSVTGVWKPVEYTGTYGTNGFYLPFSDNTTTTTLAADASGNGNNWTPNNISLTSGATYDSMTDTPTPYADGGNYAVLNPIAPASSYRVTPQQGNLYAAPDSTNSFCYATMTVPLSGKWYWEVSMSQSATYGMAIGITSSFGTASASWPANDYSYYNATGQKHSSAGYGSYGSAWWTGGTTYVLGVALDMDTGQLTFYLNGVSQGVAYTVSTTTEWIPYSLHTSGSGSSLHIWNFGQRPFAYTPPTGFKPLHTGNLPDSAIVDGSQYFDVVLRTGTGTADGQSQVISNLAFTPDLVWNKGRSLAFNHNLVDSVRGNDALLLSNSTNAETSVGTTGTQLQITANGFTAIQRVSYNATNQNGVTYAAWNWKANGAGVSNTDGSITSTVSANPTAGFSIVTYTGDGNLGGTVGHGLGIAPSLIICKERTASGNWPVYHKSVGKDGVLILNLTNGTTASSNYWGSGGVTPTVFGTSTVSGASNGTNRPIVAYCFADVEGYSKFGSYTGNGSADGPFVYTGFRPAFFMTKCTSTSSDWRIVDGIRDIDNPVVYELNANSSAAETTYSNGIDFNSNGVKIRETVESNTSGATYIYMAFAENPFKNSLAR